MNSKTSTASTTRRNAYHKPVIAFFKRAYDQMLTVGRLNSKSHYGELYNHHHKGEARPKDGSHAGPGQF